MTQQLYSAHNQCIAHDDESAMSCLRNLLLPLSAACGLAMVIWGVYRPDFWLRRSLPPGVEPSYPLAAVLCFCAIVLVKCAALWAILRPNSYCLSWQRALSASVLAATMAIFWLAGILHAPPYYGMHVQWWLLVCSALILLTLFSAGNAWWHSRHKVTG